MSFPRRCSDANASKAKGFLVEFTMAQAKKFTWGATGLAVAAVIAAFVMWIAPSRQTSSAQDGARAAAPPPLISRGYTDSPAGTAVVAGDPAGGTNLLEL